MRLITRLRVVLSALAVGAALATAPPAHAVAAGQAADPCYPTGKPIASSKHGLTVTGPAAPYAGEPTLYCGTLTLPGQPALQPVDIEANGKVIASVDAGADRAWLAWLSLTGAKPETIRAIWHRGKRDQ